MERKGHTFSNAIEVVDGNQYSECRFENCQMVYRGGEIPTIANSHFQDCEWRFEDAAERTLHFMKHLYHGMGPGGVQLIEATLAMLRQSEAQSGP